MADLTLTLRTNPVTGEKDVVVGLKSDSDAMPHEHEHHHKQLVEKLLEKGLIKPGQNVIVEREGAAVAAPGSGNESGARTPQAQGS